MHIDDKKKYIFIFGKGPTDEYSLNFTVQQRKFYLNLNCNGKISYIFVNGVEVSKFKQRILKLMQLHHVWVENKKYNNKFSVDNKKKNWIT